MSVNALLRIHLYCCVVSGLDDFVIYLSNESPTAGSELDADSYKRCTRYRADSVSAGDVLELRCDATDEQFQYVIIQSADGTKESLCLAEVSVYAPGQYLTTFLLVKQSCCV